MGWWHPHVRDQVGSQKTCKNESVSNVCLDPCLGDLFYLDGIGHHYSFHQGLQQVIDMPGIRCGFKDHMICELQVLLQPAFQIRMFHPHRLEHHSSFPVYTCNDTVVLM